MTDLASVIGAGVAGGAGGGAILLLLLKSIIARQNGLEKRQTNYETKNADEHTDIRGEIDSNETEIKKELAELNSSITKIITVMSMTNSDPRVAEVLAK